MPEHDREGGSRRVFHLIELLRQMDWAVTFIAENAIGGERYVRTLQQMGVATFASRNPWDIGAECLIAPETLISSGNYDLVLVAFWSQAERYLPLVRSLSPQTKVAVDSVDLHFLRRARNTFCNRNGGPPPTLNIQYADEMIRELNVYAAADGVLTVSQKEADLIADFTGDPHSVFAVPDTENIQLSAVPFNERKGMLFVGNFRHPPNIQAVEYLCRDILPGLNPNILADHPLSIVGNGLDETVARYAEGLENVRMVGWVPSVLPYLEGARISVIPLLYGAGTKRKLMQSLMIGTPAVSTSIGIEGLDLKDGIHVLVADDPRKFAESIARLLVDRTLWEGLVVHGREHVVARHSTEAARGYLESAISAIMNKAAKKLSN